MTLENKIKGLFNSDGYYLDSLNGEVWEGLNEFQTKNECNNLRRRGISTTYFEDKGTGNFYIKLGN